MNVCMNRIQEAVAGIAENYGVERVYLFGSYARGVANADSDIDLRIDKGHLRGLFQLAGFQQDIQEQLGAKVDVLTTQSMDKAFLQNIRDEEVKLYDRGN